jgi:hypothetical protein
MEFDLFLVFHHEVTNSQTLLQIMFNRDADESVRRIQHSARYARLIVMDYVAGPAPLLFLHKRWSRAEKIRSRYRWPYMERRSQMTGWDRSMQSQCE